MFSPPEELHKGFDKAVATLKANLGKEYGMIIDGKDVFADEKFDDFSPVNTDWKLAVMQKGNASHEQMAIAAARKKGIPVEYVIFPDEGHGFAKKPNEISGYTQVLAFLDQYLKG
jgi:acetyl esterase/lipase